MTFSLSRSVSSIALMAMAIAGGVFTQAPARAEVVARPFTYDLGDQTFEGYYSQNTGAGEDQPLVIVIHDWDGLGTYEKMRTNLLSTLGYTAVAIDLYGQGVRPTTVAEAQSESGKLYGDRPLMRDRIFAGIQAARKLPGVSPDKIAVMGYCFGGAAALEIAKTGLDFDAIVTFHGSLGDAAGVDYSQVRGPVLMLHGSADPVAPLAQITDHLAAMDGAGVAFELQVYSGAKHSFTPWDSGDYDHQADLKSWEALQDFLSDRF